MDEKKEEQLKIDLKVAQRSYESKIKDLNNKKAELEEIGFKLKDVNDEIQNLEEQLQLFKKISVIMLENYKRVEPVHAWELKDEYWELMREQQEIDNKRTETQLKTQLRQLTRQIKIIKEQEDSLKTGIKMLEDPEKGELAEVQAEIKKIELQLKGGV